MINLDRTEYEKNMTLKTFFMIVKKTVDLPLQNHFLPAKSTQFLMNQSHYVSNQDCLESRFPIHPKT